jgi:hypothetical protein
MINPPHSLRKYVPSNKNLHDTLLETKDALTLKSIRQDKTYKLTKNYVSKDERSKRKEARAERRKIIEEKHAKAKESRSKLWEKITNKFKK